MNCCNKEDEILLEINVRLSEWNGLSKKWQRIHICLAFFAVVTASATASFSSFEFVDPFWLKIIAFSNAVIVASIPLFDMRTRAINYRNAWRHLVVARLKFEANDASIKDLIDAYKNAECLIDHFNVASTNGEKKS